MAITLEVVNMTIRYADGRTMEGFILSRNEQVIRVAVKSREDAMVLTCVNGTWISEDCEPVDVEFEWQRYRRKETISEFDCICPKELAARLIHVLLSGDEDECGMIHSRDLRPMMESACHAAAQFGPPVISPSIQAPPRLFSRGYQSA